MKWEVGQHWRPREHPHHLWLVQEINEDGSAMLRMLLPVRVTRLFKQRDIPKSWERVNHDPQNSV